MAKPSQKKVIAVKLLLIVILGLVLGISCFFSGPIERALGIGPKRSGFVESAQISQDALRIHYIDVGQGDSTLIEFPDGQVMLIDAGTSKSATHIIDYLKQQKVSVIDHFIVTHSDADHVGGADKVLEAFEIKNIYRPFQISVGADGRATEYEPLGEYIDLYDKDISLVSTKTYQRFITAAYTETYTQGGVQRLSDITVFYDGLTIAVGGCTFEFFAPLVRAGADPIADERTGGYPTLYYKDAFGETSENASSPIILLEYSASSFVFTGDATEAVEKDFLESLTNGERERFSQVDIFAAGHHGSKTSNCEEFLSLLKPTYVVVSCGKDNSYGHPTQEFLDRVNALPHSVNDYLLRTDLLGDIYFGFADGQLVYTAIKEGEGVVVRWWYIALGVFVVLTIVIISVKVTSNKAATAKRVVSQTKKTVKRMKK